MPKPVMTYTMAHAAAWDAGNRSMKKGGRTRWSQEDYDACAQEFERLLPSESEPMEPPKREVDPMEGK